VIPGYVDAHTHALFAGDRSKEYDMKLNGMGYVDIYNAGLGIRFTTESVSKSTLDELIENLDKYLPRMSKLGTTTVEIKSGYGLNTENEMKMLKAIERAKIKYRKELTIISTYCGAHAIPK
jgi:imidazolonepropionase